MVDVSGFVFGWKGYGATSGKKVNSWELRIETGKVWVSFPQGLVRRMVGPRGFEPLTFCTPSKRATRLRYGP